MKLSPNVATMELSGIQYNLLKIKGLVDMRQELWG
jgi:hypothetical protein